MNENIDLFKLACWLIERIDARRAAIGNRAAIVISADALLLTGISFIIKEVLNIRPLSEIEKIIYPLSTILCSILLILSILLAINAIISVWIRSAKKVGLTSSSAEFFHSHYTVEKYNDAESFKNGYLNTNSDKMTEHAINYLWLVERLFDSRYQALRNAIKLLELSLVPFAVALGALIYNFF